MKSIEEILQAIDDHSPTVVDLPGNREESFRCKALLIKKQGQVIELVCPPHSWEADALKLGADCNLAVEHNGKTVNLIARLDSIVGDRRLHLTARAPVSPESLREYFRVSINTPVEASYIANIKEIKGRTWKLVGTTIDLSGSGILAVFDQKPPSNHRIQLVITAPEDAPPIVCLANVVRTYRIRKNRYQVAFHFETISTKTRDQIISCCLHEQRRQLRENARVA